MRRLPRRGQFRTHALYRRWRESTKKRLVGQFGNLSATPALTGRCLNRVRKPRSQAPLVRAGVRGSIRPATKKWLRFGRAVIESSGTEQSECRISIPSGELNGDKEEEFQADQESESTRESGQEACKESSPSQISARSQRIHQGPPSSDRFDQGSPPVIGNQQGSPCSARDIQGSPCSARDTRDRASYKRDRAPYRRNCASYTRNRAAPRPPA